MTLIDEEPFLPKSRHHFVPRFYLKNFASQPRRINIFNLKTGQAIRDGDLRHQCHRPHFYGETDEVEDSLSVIEGVVATTIRRIVEARRLPRPGSAEYSNLLLFLALQEARTVGTSDRLLESSGKVARLLKDNYEHIDEETLASVRLEGREATALSLQHSGDVYKTFLSLGSHLLVNGVGTGFVTSDNPVFKYNLYCEGVKGTGIVGTARSGFLLFAPLSPSLVVLLFDKDVYKVGARRAGSTVVSDPGDVRSLNLMQAVGATTTLLFSSWSDEEHVREVAARARSHRMRPRSSVIELVPDDPRGNERMILMHEACPDLKLKLSFLSVMKKARSVPMNRRLLGYRKGTGFTRNEGRPGGHGTRMWRPKE